MAVTPLFSYFWAFSTISTGTLTTGTTYNLEAFAVQSDQTPMTPWMIPSRSSKRPKPARIVLNLDQSQSPDGAWDFDWVFGYLTTNQFKYIEDNQFSSGAYWSAAATVQTLTDNGTYQAYQCTCLRPIPGENFQPEDGGFINVTYRFRGGVLL